MKTLIIFNGECRDIVFLSDLAHSFDKVICADGGYLHAVSAGIKVDVVVGDFDSSVIPDKVESIVFPKEKDLSDAEIAIEHAINNYGTDITVTCSLGKRLDHQLFNVFLLIKYPFLCIEDHDVLVFMCKQYNDLFEFENKTVSLLPLEKTNITLKNFKYTLCNHEIYPGDTTTLSNITLKNAVINVHSGKVIAIINKTDA